MYEEDEDDKNTMKGSALQPFPLSRVKGKWNCLSHDGFFSFIDHSGSEIQCLQLEVCNLSHQSTVDVD